MTIRKMNISDYEKVYAIWISCKGMGLNNLDDSREGIERFLLRNPETCFVAEADEAVVGVIMSGHDGRRGYIYHTAVLPEYKNRGIAAKLVENAMSAMKNAGINKVALVVFDRNEGGNAFWEKMGFAVREDLVYRNKNITEMTRIDT